MINVTTLILKLDGDVPRSYGVYTSLNLYVLLEHLAMLLTSTHDNKIQLRNFLNKANGIINFAKLF